MVISVRTKIRKLININEKRKTLSKKMTLKREKREIKLEDTVRG